MVRAFRRRPLYRYGASGAAFALLIAACGGGSGQTQNNGTPDAGPDVGVPGPDGSMAMGDDDATVDSGNPGPDSSNPSLDSGSDAGPAPDSGTVTPLPTVNIVVDQFGYRTGAEKIAVIRNPTMGFDADAPYTLGSMYALVDSTGAKVLEAAATAWSGGALDATSGDHAWWFDFSSVTTAGKYYVLDETSNVRSPNFLIGDDVYKDALTQATRVFYYQRDGIAKEQQYAQAGWVDGVEHPQNSQCSYYDADAGMTVKDLHGGWFDAGDQSKYTTFASEDAIDLLRAFSGSPTAFGDATGIPESGNGVPDVLDEAKYGLDWLARMQNADGSVLTIVENPGASPPSRDTTPCTYGPASTSATLAAAAAFAYGSIVLGANAAVGSTYAGYAAGLATRAANAWAWAVANPAVTFQNTAHQLGGREEEVDAAGLLAKKVEAAAVLFEMNGGTDYQTFFDASYTQLPTTIDPYDTAPVDAVLEYTKATGATSSVVSDILSTFQSRVAASLNYGGETSNGDPYMAPLQQYTPPVISELWGSNGAKLGQGNVFFDAQTYGLGADAGAPASGARYAERYIHYLHGVNPLGLVYLSNMSAHGATYSVTRLFSLWFVPNSQWGAAGISAYGPPPGFIPAGPNPSYSWDSCCPISCGSDDNNSLCGAMPLAPPAGQPAQKSYLDFNANWPLDSWQTSEPNDAYEALYIRLLSKFIQ